MTYEEASRVKCLAQPCNEVLEKLDVGCPECEGTGLVKTYFDSSVNTGKQCSICNSTGKVKYKWTPQVGEWAIRKTLKEICLITYICASSILRVAADDGASFDEPKKKFIPILPWETIGRILEKAGYSLEFTDKGIIKNYGVVIQERVKGTKAIYLGEGKFRQEAVMLAVIGLGKEK